MRKQKKIIRTCNREIYEKLNQLHFSNSTFLENVHLKVIKRILNNINKNGNLLEMEKVNDKIIVRKIKDLDFNIYLK